MSTVSNSFRVLQGSTATTLSWQHAGQVFRNRSPCFRLSLCLAYTGLRRLAREKSPTGLPRTGISMLEYSAKPKEKEIRYGKQYQ